jgi:hypothetical protein
VEHFRDVQTVLTAIAQAIAILNTVAEPTVIQTRDAPSITAGKTYLSVGAERHDHSTQEKWHLYQGCHSDTQRQLTILEQRGANDVTKKGTTPL